MNITIKTYNSAQNVYIDDVMVKSFCHMADDYAYTNAEKYVRKLRAKSIEELICIKNSERKYK